MWRAGETHIWDGHCPSSLPKPQTLWQQENQSRSDQGLCNPDPRRASAGGGSGDLGSETEPTSEVRLDTHIHCTLASTLDFTASKIHFLTQNPPRAGMGSPGSGRQCPAVRGCVPLLVLCGCCRAHGRGRGGLLSNLLQCPTVECVTREVPKGATGGQPSSNVAKGQRLRQEEESRALRTLIPGYPKHTREEWWLFLLMQNVAIQSDVGKSLLPYIGGVRKGGRESSALSSLPRVTLRARILSPSGADPIQRTGLCLELNFVDTGQERA